MDICYSSWYYKYIHLLDVKAYLYNADWLSCEIYITLMRNEHLISLEATDDRMTSNSSGRGCQTQNNSKFFFRAGDIHSQLSTVRTKQSSYMYDIRIVYTCKL